MAGEIANYRFCNSSTVFANIFIDRPRMNILQIYVKAIINLDMENVHRSSQTCTIHAQQIESIQSKKISKFTYYFTTIILHNIFML